MNTAYQPFKATYYSRFITPAENKLVILKDFAVFKWYL